MRRADPYVAQLRHFGEVAAGRAEPLVSARDAAASLTCVKAAKRPPRKPVPRSGPPAGSAAQVFAWIISSIAITATL